jgi:hypothetical protein
VRVVSACACCVSKETDSCVSVETYQSLDIEEYETTTAKDPTCVEFSIHLMK